MQRHTGYNQAKHDFYPNMADGNIKYTDIVTKPIGSGGFGGAIEANLSKTELAILRRLWRVEMAITSRR